MKSADLSPSFRFRSRAAKLLPQKMFSKLDQADHAKRVYIIPSSIGLYFTFISFTLFLIAIFYGHNLAFFATFLFFSFVSLSAVIANENTNSIVVSWRSGLVRGRVGSSIPAKIVITNKSNKVRYDVCVEVAGVTVGMIDEIAAGAQREVEVDLGRLQLERGAYEIKRFVIATRFPFGLFYAWSWKNDELSLIVHPRALSGQLPQQTRPSPEEGHGAKASSLGSSEFHEVRPHRAGESMARIDRRRSQRLGYPQVREFRDESSLTYILDLNREDVEECISFAVDWLDHAPDDCVIGLILPNRVETELARTGQHRLQLLDTLANYQRSIKRLS